MNFLKLNIYQEELDVFSIHIFIIKFPMMHYESLLHATTQNVLKIDLSFPFRNAN